MAGVTLRGMTWNHVRGYGPLLTVTERFRKLHPEVDVTWDRRSLKDFGDYPVDVLAKQYDLILIDHPHVGISSAQGVLVPLDRHVPDVYLADQVVNSVGPSHASYEWDGHQWALAVDAAAQVASYRPDLLDSALLPRMWKEVRKLADLLPAGQRIGWPLCPTDAMCSFLSLCAGIGGRDFFDVAEGVPSATGEAAVGQILELLPHLHESSLSSNPIQMYDYMAAHDDLAYVPLAFGYSNYAQKGFAPRLLRFTNIPGIAGEPAGSLLGGVGIAVSEFSTQRPLAVAFAMLAADPLIQRTLYIEGGGQPGHASAWRNEVVNKRSAGFFAETLETLSRSYMRPRHSSFPAFQEEAGALLHDALISCAGGKPVSAVDTVRAMNDLYRTLSRDS